LWGTVGKPSRREFLHRLCAIGRFCAWQARFEPGAALHKRSRYRWNQRGWHAGRRLRTGRAGMGDAGALGLGGAADESDPSFHRAKQMMISYLFSWSSNLESGARDWTGAGNFGGSQFLLRLETLRLS